MVSSQAVRDLYCTALCEHGPSHAMPECRFAHSLCALRAPHETPLLRYDDLWRRCKVDRFYGQCMSSAQLDRFWRYYRLTPLCDRPIWASGLALILDGCERDIGYALPWDFGLRRDYEDLQARRGSAPPFRKWPRLWRRLARRRCLLRQYKHPPHQLGLCLPVCGGSCISSPLSDEVPIPEQLARIQWELQSAHFPRSLELQVMASRGDDCDGSLSDLEAYSSVSAT